MTEAKRRGRVTHWTTERCIHALEDFVHRMGYVPRVAEMCERNGLPSSTTFFKAVGQSPAQYCQAQGYGKSQKQGRHKCWDAERCRTAVDNFVEQNGRFPKVVYEMTSKFGLPTPVTFAKHTGETIGQYLQKRFPQMTEKQDRSPKANKWTADSVRAALDSFYETHGRHPKGVEYHSKYGLPSHNTVTAHLGICPKVYFQQKYPAEDIWSEAKIIAAFEQFYNKHGRYPRTLELGVENGLPMVSTILRHTGEASYRSFCENYLSYTPKSVQNWTKEMCIQAVESFIERNGRYPKSTECTTSNGLPHYRTFQLMTEQTVFQFCKQNYPDYLTPKVWSKAACIEAVDNFVTEHGRCPTFADCKASDALPQYALFVKRVGKTILAYCRENYSPAISAQSAKNTWTELEICQAIEAFAEREGRMPTTEEFLTENLLPSLGTVIRHTGKSAGAFMREKYPEYYDSQEQTQGFGFGMQML